MLDPTPIGQDDVQRSLQDLDIHDIPVCIHSSLKSFGWLEGGPGALLGGFLSQGCTVLVPTFSDGYFIPPPPGLRPRRNGWDYDAHPASPRLLRRVYSTASQEISVRDMGIFAAHVLRHPQSVRGDHPLNSFSAIGPLANELITRQSGDQVYAPLKALSEHQGWVILMGVDLTRLTLIHLAEELAGRTLFRRWAYDQEGEPRMVACGGCSEAFERFSPHFQSFEKTCRVVESTWRVFPVRPLLKTATEILKKNPAITHCGDPSCERCPDAVLGGPILEA